MEDPDKLWAEEMDRRQANGVNLLGEASNEALEYITTVVDNLNDPEYRRIAVDTQATEMGIGKALVEIVAPIAIDMDKSLPRSLKMLPKNKRKEVGTMLRAIYLGRTIKNIIKEMNQETNRGDK